MNQNKVLKPRCIGCKYRLMYLNNDNKQEGGTILEFGKEYCTAGNKYRVFKSRDPKMYLPSWCPKQKSPSEFRVYDFKNTESWFFYQLSNKSKVPPSYRCAVRLFGKVRLSPIEFFQKSTTIGVSTLLGVGVHIGEIVEIDDGLQPYCFYIRQCGIEVLSHWFPEKSATERIRS